MSISLKASGTWTEFTGTTAAPGIPGTPAAGDRMYAWVIWKNQSVTSSHVPGTWTKITEYKDGSVASGNGSGSVTIACYYRDWESGDGAPTFTLSASAGIGVHVMQVWSKDAGEAWDIPVSTNAPWTTAATAQRVISSGTVSVPDGSVVMNAMGVQDDGTFSRATTALNGWKTIATDDFTRANSTTSAGSNWTNRWLNLGVSSNKCYGASANNNANTGTHNTQSPSDDAAVQAVPSSSNDTTSSQSLILNSSSATQVFVALNINAGNNFIGLYTAPAWTLGGNTNRAAIAGGITDGHTVRLSRVGDTFDVYTNRTWRARWVDAAAAQPRNSSNRLCGLHLYNATATNNARWDDFAIEAPLTFNGNYVENPATAFSTTTGNDMSADLGHRFVTTGGTGVTLDCEATLAAAETAAILWVVQSTSAAGTPVSADLSGSGSLTATATIEYDRTASLTGSGALSATGSAMLSNSASGNGTLTAIVSPIYPATTADLAGTGTLSATAIVQVQTSAQLSGAGTLVATASPGYPASLSGDGTLTALVAQKYFLTAGLAGAGTLTATVTPLLPAALSGAGTLTATVAQTYSLAAVLAGAGVLSAGAAFAVASSAALSGSGTLSATVATGQAAALSGSGTLSATVSPRLPAALAGAGTLSATVTPSLQAVLSGSGALSATGSASLAQSLSGFGNLTATAAVALPVPLSGAGTLSATVSPRLPAALSGSGTLSATVLKVATRTAPLSGGGTLTATTLKVATRVVDLSGTGVLTAAAGIASADRALPLAGDGALTAQVAIRQSVTLNLHSTGQLLADLSYPTPSEGWTTDPVPPVRRWGPGWTTAATVPATKIRSGWFVILEKVGQHVGEGHLSAVMAPRVRTTVALEGTGAMAPALAQRVYRTVAFSGLGLPTAGYPYELVTDVVVSFSGGGVLSVALNDGLSAIVQGGYPARFSGGGDFVTDVEGGHGVQDGLSAVVYPIYSSILALAGVGTFSGIAAGVTGTAGILAGSGVLSATVEALGGAAEQMFPELAGTGALSAALDSGHHYYDSFDGAPFNGGGTLSATVKPIVPIGASLSGGGTLAATAFVIKFLIDTFTDTNGVVLTSHIGEQGATWTKMPSNAGVLTVQANRLYCSTSPAATYASGVAMTPDYDVTVAIRVVTTAVNMEIGAIGRSADAANTYYVAFMDRVSSGGGTVRARLGKFVNNTFTALGSAVTITPAASSDHTITLRMVGTAISCLYDGVVTVGPITDSSITEAGEAGVHAITASSTTTGFHLDSIEATL